MIKKDRIVTLEIPYLWVKILKDAIEDNEPSYDTEDPRFDEYFSLMGYLTDVMNEENEEDAYDEDTEIEEAINLEELEKE